MSTGDLASGNTCNIFFINKLALYIKIRLRILPTGFSIASTLVLSEYHSIFGGTEVLDLLQNGTYDPLADARSSLMMVVVARLTDSSFPGRYNTQPL